MPPPPPPLCPALSMQLAAISLFVKTLVLPASQMMLCGWSVKELRGNVHEPHTPYSSSNWERVEEASDS